MFLKNTFLLFSFLSLVRICSAQNSFYTRQETIFKSSTEQWICTELSALNKNHFVCNGKATWTIPSKDSCSVFGKKFYIGPKEKTQFRELVFPGGDCKRYLQLVSLCDLYFPLFRKKIEASQLHLDYKLFPLLLSGCNQNFSDVEGRSGLWALDYLLARRLHLRVDSLIDERKGGDFTSDAAIRYIGELSTKFNGDPVRTIVAYRKGVPYVNELEANLSGDEFFFQLDEESKVFIRFYAYLSELISSTRIDNQLNNYFDIFGQFESSFFEKNVKVPALVSVLKQDLYIMRQMNPVYTGNEIESTYRKVPFVMDKVASLKFEALQDSVYNWQPPVAVAPRMREETTVYYKVKKGDSLGKIASKYGVSVSQLKKWNKIKGDRISRGQQLKIIREEYVSREVPEIKPPAKEIPAPPSPLDPKPSPDSFEGLVKAGDSFMQKKNYSSAALKYEKALDIDPGNTAVTDKLKNAREKRDAAKDNQGKITYTVKSGDSLWKIAQKYKGVTEKDIMKWNKCSENIRPGQKLVIHTK